jgi:hypothetical protein
LVTFHAFPLEKHGRTYPLSQFFGHMNSFVTKNIKKFSLKKDVTFILMGTVNIFTCSHRQMHKFSEDVLFY